MLEVGRQWPWPDGDHSPQPAIDVDRHGGRRPDPLAERRLAARNALVVIDPSGLAGTPDGRCQPGWRIALPAFSDSHVGGGAALVGHERRSSVKLEADHPGGADTETPQSFLGRRREHSLGRFAPRDQHGQAPQCRLGVREFVQFLVGLGVGDGGRGELREIRHAVGGAGRKRPSPRHHGHHAPQAAFDDDRARHHRPDAQHA
jgi:hypothetical protein